MEIPTIGFTALLRMNTMIRFSGLICLIIPFCAIAGCGEQSKEAPVVSVPESVLFAVGGKNSIPVTVDREALSEKTTDVAAQGDIQVTIAHLPDKVSIANKQSTIVLKKERDEKTKKTKMKQTAKFELLVDSTVDVPEKAPKVKITVSADSFHETKEVELNIRDFELSSGWPVMLISIGSVLGLLGFCLYRVFSLPPVEVEETLEGPTTIDLPDTKDPD